LIGARPKPDTTGNAVTLRTCLFATTLICAAAFRLVALDRPFHYDEEATSGSFYGVLARNYVRRPWTETHGIPVLTVGSLSGVPVTFYYDHPPLVPLLIFPMYKMFGVGEWQTRLPTSVATVLAIGVLYRLMRRFGTERAAVIAAAVFAATPMVLYFGGQPEVLGMPLVLFALLAIHAYLTFHREANRAAFARLVGAFTLAAISDWPAFILVPVLAGHFVATRRRQEWGWIVLFCAIATAEFALLNVYIAVAANLPWDWIVPLFKGRSAIGITAPFTADEWLRTAWMSNRHFHTTPLVITASTWVVLRSVRVAIGPHPGDSAARLLLAWGVLHVLIGRQGVYSHDWWWWPLTPGLAVAAALLAEGTLETIERSNGRRPARIAGAVLIVIVAVFAAWTAITEYRELFSSQQADDSFTTVQLGRAIQAAAPGPNDLAMLAWSGNDPELWFYGDRPLRANIWSVGDFLARLPGTDADLAFGYPQPWPARATGLVFPVLSLGAVPELHAYLAMRYPLVRLPQDLATHFKVFDVR
jgi:hypothetical protein